MDRATDSIETVTVETAEGRLAGLRKGAIAAFKGIPFAEPPVGPLRWRAPRQARAWSGVRDATRFGPICPQGATQAEMLMGSTPGEQSEDCLYLNVWTPACDDAKRPVMVWIHGGAFVIGAGSQGLYSGRHLAALDCVIVTINYRLGAFGFLDLADATDGAAPGSGSEGIADQILALQWVKRNIARFGGDPKNVTVFGESAGGMSVAALMASPAARGLFHKAILQSGAGHVGHERDRAARAGHALLSMMGLSPSEWEKAREALMAAVLKAQIALLADARDGKDTHRLSGLPFQPAIDGALLPSRPIEAIRAGSAKGIPVLAGTTREEWKLFTAADPRLRLMSRASFEERVTRLAGEHAPEMLAAYGEGSTFDRFNALMTDKAFTIPAVRLLEAQGARAPSYAYRFDWRSPLLGGLMGSCHALELGFVFGTYNAKLAGAFFGVGSAADALSRAMMGCWVAFARSGNPAAAGAGPWPRYDAAARAVMIFGDGSPHVVERPNEPRRLAWDPMPERRLGP
jgi:para-nitrobenzyl esterase